QCLRALVGPLLGDLPRLGRGGWLAPRSAPSPRRGGLLLPLPRLRCGAQPDLLLAHRLAAPEECERLPVLLALLRRRRVALDERAEPLHRRPRLALRGGEALRPLGALEHLALRPARHLAALAEEVVLHLGREAHALPARSPRSGGPAAGPGGGPSGAAGACAADLRRQL